MFDPRRMNPRLGFEVTVSNYILEYNLDNLFNHDRLELYGEPYVNEDGHFCQCANDDKYDWVLEMVNGAIKLVYVGERSNPS